MLAILSTVLCCLPAGIVSIVYAAKVNGLWDSGQYAQAQAAAESAKKWAIISAGVTMVGLVLYVISSSFSGRAVRSPREVIDLSRRALPRWVSLAATGVAVAAAGALLTVRDPRVPGAHAICSSLALTGTYCPGCGSLRAVNRLLAGDLAGAVGYNVLAVAVVPVLVYAWVAWALPPRLTARWPGSGPRRPGRSTPSR